MSDLQDIIASNTVRAFNAGYSAGLEKAMQAAKFVSFEHSDFDAPILSLSDFQEEAKHE